MVQQLLLVLFFLSCFVQRGLRVPRVLLLLCARELLAR